MGSYIFHISILKYRWLEFPYSKFFYGLIGYVVNDLMLDMICYYYLILVFIYISSWCFFGCNVLNSLSYYYHIFLYAWLWMFFSKGILGSSTCRTDCLLSLCIVVVVEFDWLLGYNPTYQCNISMDAMLCDSPLFG
jgi:hypothetical protein